MTDISWLSQEAQSIHDIFRSLFFLLATIFLLFGVVIEYFKLPLSGSANFSVLVIRVIIATVILVAYPEVTNWIADIADTLSERVGDLNSAHQIKNKTLKIIEKKSWSWTSVGENFIWIVAYIVYAILCFSIFLYDAIILYGWTLLYIFSPILILMYILPSTARATQLLFRSHIELACYKVVWSVLGTLLWSTALNNLNSELQNKPNFFTILTYLVIVAFSIIFTPRVVNGLTRSGIGSVATQVGGTGLALASAGALGPLGLGRVMHNSATFPIKKGKHLAYSGFQWTKNTMQRQRNLRSSNVINLKKYKKNLNNNS